MTNTNENNKKYSTEDSIEKLQELLDSSFEVPGLFSFIKPKQLNDALSQIKAAVAEELKESRAIIAEKESIISDAENTANNMIRSKQLELESQDIVRQAQMYAKKVVSEAQQQAKEFVEEGKKIQDQLIISGHKYVDQILQDLETKLQTDTKKIMENRKDLNSSLISKTNNGQLGIH